MAITTVEVHGSVASRFERVREAFAENFALFPEVGASVAVMIDGDLVIDLWGGHTDLGRGTEWGKDTIVNVWSSTKGATALAAHMLAERGELDCDAPVTRYWPEFGQQGKGEMPVRYLLTHESGLHQMPPQLPATAAYDWSTMVEALAAQRPAWEPGSKHQYEALTFGWLVGEVIRRVSGKTPGKIVRDEIAGPLGIDCFIACQRRRTRGWPRSCATSASRSHLPARWARSTGTAASAGRPRSQPPTDTPTLARHDLRCARSWRRARWRAAAPARIRCARRADTGRWRGAVGDARVAHAGLHAPLRAGR